MHGISQARILERVAFPSPGGLPNPGIKPIALAGGFFATEPPGSQFCFVFFKTCSHSILFTEREREVNSIEDSILPLTPLSDL